MNLQNRKTLVRLLRADGKFQRLDKCRRNTLAGMLLSKNTDGQDDAIAGLVRLRVLKWEYRIWSHDIDVGDGSFLPDLARGEMRLIFR